MFMMNLLESLLKKTDLGRSKKTPRNPEVKKKSRKQRLKNSEGPGRWPSEVTG